MWMLQSTPHKITSGSETTDPAVPWMKLREDRVRERLSCTSNDSFDTPRKERNCLVRKEENKRERKLFQGREKIPLRQYLQEGLGKSMRRHLPTPARQGSSDLTFRFF